MELVEAITTRRSIRGYQVTPVPKDVLSQILNLARLSPSGLNHQPWEFVVLTGRSLQKAKQVNVDQAIAGAQWCPDVPGYRLSGPYRERQVALGKAMFHVMGIEREDTQKRTEWGLKGIRFYDAPAAILICADEAVLNAQSQMALVDLGIVTQSIALLATAYGLGTCIEGAAVAYADALRKALEIADAKRLVLALAIGYPAEDLPANRLQTDRESLDVLTAWKD